MFFLNTLTTYGYYHFTDNWDGFHWFVHVESDDDETSIGQTYWSSEEGIQYLSYRTGHFVGDEYEWSDWTTFLTYESANSMFAAKAHSHYTNKTFDTNADFLAWLEKFNPGDDWRITVSETSKFYFVAQNSVNFSTPKKYIRTQKYWEINEPWKIYSRVSVNTTTTLKWAAWHTTTDADDILRGIENGSY